MVEVIAAGAGAGVWLKAGQRLRVIDPHGGQSGDLVAYTPDGRERLSNGRTFDHGGKIYLTTGDVLWSDRSRPMLTIVADEVGRHDFLYGSCTVEMYRLEYKMEGHPNCTDALDGALRRLGIEPGPPQTAFNLFMVAEVGDDGRLELKPPRSRAGDAIVLRAEMDLAVAVSSCPATGCNAGPPGPLAFEILED